MSYSQTSSSNIEALGASVESAPDSAVESLGQNESDASARLERLLRRFGNVRLALSCDLGRTNMELKALLALEAGSVVTVDRPVGEDLGLRLNGVFLGKADVMVVDSRVLLRITEIRHED